jgi:hypothetical protein
MGGSAVLSRFGSIRKALQHVFPETDWKHLEPQIENPKNVWTKENQLAKIQEVEKILNIKSKEDWYTISSTKLTEAGGAALLYPSTYTYCDCITDRMLQCWR